MTKNKTLLFGYRRFSIFLAALFIFASCISESVYIPVSSEYGGERTVSLRLVQSEESTRGVSRPVCNGEPVQFNTGDLYLVTSAGIIVRHFSIVACDGTSATETDTEVGRVNRNDLDVGVMLPSMPGSVTRVVVVGNHSQSALPTAGVVGTAVENRLIHNHILSQHNVHTPGVNLFGERDLTRRYISGVPQYSPPPPTGTGNVLWEATVYLAPTVARFELAQITGTGYIADFTVAGIFIDRHYRQARINGYIPHHNVMPVSPNRMERGTTSAEFQPGQPYYTFIGSSTTSGALFDLPNRRGMRPGVPGFLDGHTLSVTPGTMSGNFDCTSATCTLPGSTHNFPNVWSYQVFACEYIRPGQPVTPAVTAPPRIVVRLTNVRTFDGTDFTDLGTQYITVTGFSVTETGAPLTGIRAGNVYRINNLAFNESHLSDRPNERPIIAEITVTLARWSGRPIGGNLRQPNPQNVPINCFADHTFTVGAAVCGNCVGGTFTYLWQQSYDRVNWITAVGTPLLQGRTFRTASLIVSTYYRRVAICSCRPNLTHASGWARVSLPEPVRSASDFPLCVAVGTRGDGTPIHWATRNVCLTTTNCSDTHLDYRGFTYHPADVGMLFQWGSGIGWDAVSLTADSRPTWRWCQIENTWIPSVAGDWRLQPELHNLTHWNNHQGPCPDGWRLPNQEEIAIINNLINASAPANPRATWIAVDGQMGCRAGHLVHADLFLPAAGSRSPIGTISQPNVRGAYWTSTVNVGLHNNIMEDLRFYAEEAWLPLGNPAMARSVRCVRE